MGKIITLRSSAAGGGLHFTVRCIFFWEWAMRYLPILAVLLMAFGKSPAAAGDDTDEKVREFMHCVRGMAERLEPSDDAPTDVAMAAVFMCSDKEIAAANAVLNDRDSGITPTKLRETAEFYGAAQTTIARLCRKTRDCGLAPIR
ncbi:hypothetical protein EHS39_23875 [Ensifer sp. MPMI2T]|nr:hypothetical protein EHS39_23875 [Ensifer sp. MPMI2T]